MKTFLTLDIKGGIAAIFVAVFLLVFGGGNGLFFLALMFAFLVASALATRFGKEVKKKLGVYDKSRGWKNVLANGAVPCIAALLYFLFAGSPSASSFAAAYVATIAGITADKFGSEIGVIDTNTRMLLTLRKARRGISGAVSLLGLVVSLIGAFIIAALALAFGLLNVNTFAIVVASGFVGNLADSAFGYFENKGIGNKYTSNVMCSLGAWVCCMLLLLY
ncbi:MAG: DUF92 domain-containing protein [Candidatus Micrarchaeota archaeon]|nr:DUF92 domain-containing protein [Candidatus Micrarchaeota archaeon]